LNCHFDTKTRIVGWNSYLVNTVTIQPYIIKENTYQNSVCVSPGQVIMSAEPETTTLDGANEGECQPKKKL
jgi:hypothetical protein